MHGQHVVRFWFLTCVRLLRSMCPSFLMFSKPLENLYSMRRKSRETQELVLHIRKAAVWDAVVTKAWFVHTILIMKQLKKSIYQTGDTYVGEKVNNSAIVLCTRRMNPLVISCSIGVLILMKTFGIKGLEDMFQKIGQQGHQTRTHCLFLWSFVKD